MKIINNKKGSALLWCILLTIILTILLGAVTTASYAYFNYTMNTVKRQQAYFTARSAINIVLENLSSVEQAKETATTETATSSGYTMNFDGNYIKDANGDGIKDIVNARGTVLYYGTNVAHNTFTNAYINKSAKYMDADGYYIEDYTKTKRLQTQNYIKRDKKVLQATSSTGANYTQSSSEIDLLPAQNSTIEVTDFGFDASTMGLATANISRNEKDEITIEVTSYYPDADGEKYEMKATVVRQPLYFGGIAVKNLDMKGNFKLGDGTDFYWNNTDEFNTAGNGSSLKVASGKKFTIKGNLVTKGNATITPGNQITGKNFLSETKFENNVLKQKKIWNSSQYIISNKTLLVGDTSTEYTQNTYGAVAAFFEGADHFEYCNNRSGNSTFGSYFAGGSEALRGLLSFVGLENAYDGLKDSTHALTNNENDAMAIQYIKILSLSNSVEQYLEENTKDVNNLFDLGGAIISDMALSFYNNTFKNLTLNTLDASYIDYSSRNENNRSDEVVPLTYLNLEPGITVRVRYGCDPGNRTRLGQAVEGVLNNAEAFLARVFDIQSNAAYNVIYMGENTTLHLGYDDDNHRNNNGNRAADIFYYTVYGGAGSTVYIHSNCIVVGEIICDNLIVEDGAQVIYSSTNGSQVAKQKIAEYWSVSNYSD